MGELADFKVKGARAYPEKCTYYRKNNTAQFKRVFWAILCWAFLSYMSKKPFTALLPPRWRRSRR
jgi:hypothetical protein